MTLGGMVRNHLCYLSITARNMSANFWSVEEETSVEIGEKWRVNNAVEEVLGTAGLAIEYFTGRTTSG